MDIKSLISGVLSVAKMAGNVIPGLGAGAALGEKIIGIIDDLSDQAPDARTQQEMQVARKALSTAVEAKAKATSARLRG